MKKLIYLMVVIAILGLIVSGCSIPLKSVVPISEKGNPKPELGTPEIDKLVFVHPKAPDLEKIEFIHWRKGYGKPEGAGKPPKVPTCYDFIGQYGKKLLKWGELPVSYVINPVNPVQELDEDLVTDAVFNGAEEWDDNTSAELSNDIYTTSTGPETAYGLQNYENAISFGNYPTTNVIAVTTVWYNPATKAIVEFDVMFDTDWVWGDADPNNDFVVDNFDVMDLQNISIHELGHGFGLDDVYDSNCSAVTMYGVSNYGEIQKRTLETPDITGIQTLYEN
ncbi:matrixin family metalloprotease [bacterium]|nr:matrixin family metalloprotease [bacterium]